jgi:GGDEF domain-containing protein
MLMSTLGVLRQPAQARAVLAGVIACALLVVTASWLLPARGALALGSLVAFGAGTMMLIVSARGALRGDRGGWTIVAGIACMLAAIAGLTWIAWTGTQAWPVHAASALAGILYLVVVATVLWARYSYLIELAEVMAHGPSYDPVTRMPSHTETGQMVGELFFKRAEEARPVGVIAISIANLYALENLHGRAAFNHALFVCAGRLRRCVPQNVEMGRLGEDGFLLLVRHAGEVEQLAPLARQIRARLLRPLTLSTGADAASLDQARTAWVPEAGIGVLATTTHARPVHAVATARAMARTAWTYASRLACYDPDAGQIAELPLEDAGGLGPAAGAAA